jgi:hypothetical protein
MANLIRHTEAMLATRAETVTAQGATRVPATVAAVERVGVAAVVEVEEVAAAVAAEVVAEEADEAGKVVDIVIKDRPARQGEEASSEKGPGKGHGKRGL